MGWFAEIETKPVGCPRCGEPMDVIQTKGWDGDGDYFIENGKPYLMDLTETFEIASEITAGGSTAVHGINSCSGCSIYADWTFYKTKEDI